MEIYGHVIKLLPLSAFCPSSSPTARIINNVELLFQKIARYVKCFTVDVHPKKSRKKLHRYRMQLSSADNATRVNIKDD